MILLILFLSFLLGAYARLMPVLSIIYAFVFLIFLSKRFGKRLAIVSSLFTAVGILLSLINFSPLASSFSGVVFQSKTNYFLLNSGGQRFYVNNKNNQFEIGDFLSIEGEVKELSFVKLESSFDFKEYLNKKGVRKELEVKKITVKFTNPLRINKYRKSFLSNFNDVSAAFISGILFGEREENEVNYYSNIFHLGRLVSISGIFLYAFLRFFSFLFSFFFKMKYADLASSIVLTSFTIFTFPNFTVIRIMLLTFLKWINTYILKNKISYFTLLSGTAFFFVLCDFYHVYNDSFILGYTIPIVFRIASRIVQDKKRIARKLITSLFVYSFFIPFEINYYNSINLLTFPLQFIFAPFYIMIGIVALLCFYKLPAYFVVNHLTGGLTNILKWLSPISLEIYAPPLNKYLFSIMLVLYFVFLYYLSIGFRPFIRLVSLFMGTAYLLNFLPIKTMISNQVTFVNVGQGDCCMIRNQFTTILIDTGGSLYYDIANDTLIPYFKKNKIYNIDLVITTHDDYDHMGALEELKKNFNVIRYVKDADEFPIKIGKITLNNYNNFTTQDEEKNESSLVIGFNLCNKDFLITGDAPIGIENKIMSTYSSIPCDVLKVGHHGSNTSTSDRFVKYLSPKDAIISVGRNYYGHPQPSVLTTLKNNNVNIYRTDQIGSITYFNYIFM